MGRDSVASERAILEHLEAVSRERLLRMSDAGLGHAVAAVKVYQQRRFEFTYSDMLDSPRFGDAARFFLNDLYGPDDFSRLDAAFARVVPSLVRLFPQEVVDTVRLLGELHAVSESMDTAMGTALGNRALDSQVYASCWRRSGSRSLRQHQLALLLEVGSALDRLTRKPFLRQALRLMRAPAMSAGLGDLQQFLERGFDCFRAMRGADGFLSAIESRENHLMDLLFEDSGAQPDLRQWLPD